MLRILQLFNSIIAVKLALGVILEQEVTEFLGRGHYERQKRENTG